MCLNVGCEHMAIHSFVPPPQSQSEANYIRYSRLCGYVATLRVFGFQFPILSGDNTVL